MSKKVTCIKWHEVNIVHIARHAVEPEEVEDVCFSQSSFMRKGREALYYVMGQTRAGRYLFIVIRHLGHGQARVVTARTMSEKEKSRYKKGKR